jgi:hypothetical protein
MQEAGLISYRRGKMQGLNRLDLEKASCECYEVVKKRFDAFLMPRSTAGRGNRWKRRQTSAQGSQDIG